MGECSSNAVPVSTAFDGAELVCEISVVNDVTAFQELLIANNPDIVLADTQVLPIFAIEALNFIKSRHLKIPLIALGTVGAAVNPAHLLDIMKNGAADYVFKDEIEKLPLAVVKAINKQAAESITKNDFSDFDISVDEMFFSRDMVNDKFIRISPGCENIYGYTVEEFLADPELYVRVYQPEDRHLLQDFIVQLRNGEQVFSKYRIVHKDGTIRWVASRIIPVFDHHGNFSKIEGITRDITQAHATESSLQISEQRFRALLENSSDVTATTNFEGAITYISSNAKKILGFSAEEMIGKTLADCFHADDLQSRKAIFMGVRKNPGKIYPFVHRFKKANGTWIWVEGTVKNLLEYPAVNGIVCNFREITDRKLAEEGIERNHLKLIESTETQEAILNALPTNIALINEEGIIIEVNESWKRFAISNDLTISNYGIGSNYISIIEHSDEEAGYNGKEVARGIRDVIQGNRKEFIVEYPCHSPSEKRFFQMVVAPVADKVLKGAVVLHINITARMLAEEKMAQSEQRYRQIVETAQEGIWILDEKLETIFVNRKMSEILGYPIEEIMGKHNYDFKLKDEKAKSIARLANRSAGDVESHESEFITKRGYKVICNVNTIGLMGPDGHFLGTLAMLTDITHRKADEAALKKSAANLLAIIENTADLVYSVDKDLNLITYNQQFKKAMSMVYGFEVGENDNAARLLGKLDPEVAEKWRTIYNKALDGETQQYVFAYPFNGETIYLSYSINPTWESGNVIGFSVFSRDITRQKLDELAIRKSEANLTAIIENTNSSIYSLDRELKYITFNSVMKEKVKHFHGTEIHPGDNVMDTLIVSSPAEYAEWEAIYKKALSGEAVQFTTEFKQNEFTSFVTFSINPICDNGVVTGLSCAATDITRQKQDELAVKKSEANLTAIIENNDASVYSLDRELRFIAFNKITSSKMLQYFGIHIKAGDKILAPLAGASNVITSEWEGHYQKALNGEIVQFVKELPLNGGIAFVNYSFYPIWENNEVTGLSAVVRDISQQKSDEIAIKKSEASLRTILNNTDMACILLDSAGNIVSFNNLAKQFSLQQNNFTIKQGDYIIDCIPEDRRAFVTNVLKDVKNGTAINYQLNRMVDGISRWYDMTWSTIKDEGNADFGYLFTNREITEQKKLEIEREKITNELIQRNKALEEFTYVISHNLRAPVANIIGLSSLFDGVAPHSNEYFKIVRSISKSADKLDDVISDLNQVMQVSVQVNERIEVVFLSQLIADLKINIKPLIEKENVKINCNFGQCEQMLSVKSSLYSIFNNLILNSIKFYRAEAAPIINISAEINQGKIIISYKDNGRGIDTSRYANDIFGLYKRFDTSVEGKGMGLFMVKMQVEGLGGKIIVNSKLNEGTEFVIAFPQVKLLEA